MATKLGAFLKARGSKQADVAELLGISQTALSMKANGKTPFKQGEIERIKKHFDMTPEEIDRLFF